MKVLHINTAQITSSSNISHMLLCTFHSFPLLLIIYIQALPSHKTTAEAFVVIIPRFWLYLVGGHYRVELLDNERLQDY